MHIGQKGANKCHTKHAMQTYGVAGWQVEIYIYIYIYIYISKVSQNSSVVEALGRICCHGISAQIEKSSA